MFPGEFVFFADQPPATKEAYWRAMGLDPPEAAQQRALSRK
jgi:hypothetical protein